MGKKRKRKEAPCACGCKPLEANEARIILTVPSMTRDYLEMVAERGTIYGYDVESIADMLLRLRVQELIEQEPEYGTRWR